MPNDVCDKRKTNFAVAAAEDEKRMKREGKRLLPPGGGVLTITVPSCGFTLSGVRKAVDLDQTWFDMKAGVPKCVGVGG